MNHIKNSSPIINTPSVINRIGKRYIPRWPFFLMASIVAIVCVYIYLKDTKNVYEIKATLVIKDKDKVDKDKTDLQELDMANPSKKVEIEVEVFKSRKLVAKVINDLKLWVGYELATNNKKEQLYSTTPLIYKSIETVPYGKYIFNVKILDSNSFEINTNGKITKRPFNKIFKSDYGLAVIQSTTYVKQYIGSTIKVTLQDTDAVINNIQSAYEARLVDKLQPVVELDMHDENVERGKDFLNRIILEYNNQNTEEKNRLTDNTLLFIDKRLDSLSGELTHVEKNIEGYKSSRGITDISSESNAYLQSMQSNDVRLNEVNVQLKIIEGIEKYVNSPGTNNVPATIGIEDKGLVSLIDQLAKLQLERNKLLATTPETNYLFEPIKKQIASTVAAIKENVGNIKASLLNIKSGLQSVDNKVQNSIKELPGQERGYISIKRQQEVKENLYTYLLQKREQVALSYASILTDVNVIDKAYVSTIIWPKKSLMYTLGLLIAIGFTAGIIFFIDLAGNKTNSVDEIEEILDESVLSEFVNVKTDSPMVVLNEAQAFITQQFRTLRTSLHYLHTDKQKARVILVSSSKTNEGKSFITTNLAISLAASARKTVIIDFDLHKPSISKIFDLPENHLGVSDFLNNEATIDELIQPSKVNDNLKIISAGNKVSNPSELIENNLIGKLISALESTYDDIILDTPPLHLVTDAYIVSAFTDISLYIVRRGVTKKSELNFIKKLFTEQRLPKLNVIFNGAAGRREDTVY